MSSAPAKPTTGLKESQLLLSGSWLDLMRQIPMTNTETPRKYLRSRGHGLTLRMGPTHSCGLGLWMWFWAHLW